MSDSDTRMDVQNDSEPDLTDQEFAQRTALVFGAPGRAVYVQTDSPFVFRIGNVESESSRELLISFEDPSGGKRDPSEVVARNLVVEPNEMDNMPRSRRDFVAGRRLVRQTSRGCVEVVEIQETLIGPSRNVIARPVKYDGSTWLTELNSLEYPRDQIHSPYFLAFVHQWRWLQPVDPFFDVIAEPVGTVGNIDGVAYLQIKDICVPLDARLVLGGVKAEIEATAHPTVGLLLNDLPVRLMVRALVESETRPAWTAKLVAIHGTSNAWAFDSGHAPGRVSLTSPWITVSLTNSVPKFTREVYTGISFKAGTDAILQRDPPYPAHPLLRAYPMGIRTTIFGRPALVYTPPCESEQAGEITGVLYHGRPLMASERRALTSLVGYLAGGRAAHVLTETFNVERKISMQFVDRGGSTGRLSPPVPLSAPTPHAKLITQHISQLASRLAEIYRTGDARSLDAALHHYSEGVDSLYPTTRVLRMSVAFEALVNLVSGDNAPNEPIVSKTKFRRLSRALRSSLKSCEGPAANELSEEEAKRFRAKIDALNLASNTQRIKQFWTITGVRRTKADDALIRRLRNDSVHNGFVGDESSARALWRVHRDADRLITLFNRCFLAYLGYRGPVSTADGKRWIHAKSGRKFVVPEIPKGPEIRIDMTANPTPPLSAGDIAALESLRRIGRNSSSTASPG